MEWFKKTFTGLGLLAALGLGTGWMVGCGSEEPADALEEAAAEAEDAAEDAVDAAEDAAGDAAGALEDATN